MTLRNVMAQLIDYRDLNGVIESNPKFAPSDIDMIYERNGHFLVAEWKKPDESFGGGQEIMLKSLAKIPQFTVIKVCGASYETRLVVDDIYWMTSSGFWKPAGYGVERLKEFIKNWYAKVDNVS